MLVLAGTAFARANWGRWIADCVRCPSAMMLWRFQPVFNCQDCGERCEIMWPPEETVYGIERLLLMRPRPENQNWDGETLTELMWENGVHGIFDKPRGELVVDGVGIRRDELPASFRPELRAVSA